MLASDAEMATIAVVAAYDVAYDVAEKTCEQKNY
jgi:hypothetical protein